MEHKTHFCIALRPAFSRDYRGGLQFNFPSGGGLSDLRRLYPDVNIAGGKRLNDATEMDVKEWIDSLH